MKLRQARLGLILALCATTALFAIAPAALAAKPGAADKSEINEEDIPGEAVIAMKYQFVKFTVDGKEWDNHEYTTGAKTLVIRGIGRADPHTVVLMPREPGIDSMTLNMESKDFKRLVVREKGKTQTLVFRANFKVDFPKLAAEPKPNADGDKAKDADKEKSKDK